MRHALTKAAKHWICGRLKDDGTTAKRRHGAVVGHDHHSPRGRQLSKQSHYTADKRRIQVGGRLISDDEFDVASEHPSNGHALALAAT